jgi:uncharacterized protein with PQ loop repeat
MISLSALEAYISYAKNAQSNGLSIEGIDKAMADQGVDEYSRSLVTKQLRASTQDGLTGPATAAKTANSRKRIIGTGIYVVAAIEPLGVVPQIYAIFSRHNASSVAILTWISFVVFDIAWLWYGWEANQKPLVIFSALFILLELLVVVGALIYGGRW